MLSRLIAPKLRNDLGMDRATLQQRLQEAEALMQRMEENIAFQGRMIATLDRGGHDVKAAKMFLRRLEGEARSHIADRDRLFENLTDTQSDPPTPSNRRKSPT